MSDQPGTAAYPKGPESQPTPPLPPVNRTPMYPPCGAVEPGTLYDCANVKPLGATVCAGPHRFRKEHNRRDEPGSGVARCHPSCILDWPHYGEACLVE